MEKPPVGLMVVGQDRLLVEAVVAWLGARPDFRVIEPATRAISATLEAARDVDVVLIDTSRGRDEALAAAWRVGEELPRAKILVFGLDGEGEEVLDFVEAGALGYLWEGASAADLAVAIHDVHAGRTRCSPQIAAAALTRIARLAQIGRHRPLAAGLREPLTGRELEILRLLSDGLSNKEIVGFLSISLSTVKNHVHNLLAKLGVRRRREAIRLAYEHGLLPGLLGERRRG
jgi:two-component system nitrate/nitrite response regulator NarL